MTGDERLAKVAEVLAGHRLTTPVQCSCGWREHWSGAGEIHAEHQAAAVKPLLDEFRAEDEARALREAGQDFLAQFAGCGVQAIRVRRWLFDRAAPTAAEPADWASAVNAASLRTVKTLHASAALAAHWSCDGQTEGAAVRWSCGIETPSGPSQRQAHLASALAAAEPDAGAR